MKRTALVTGAYGAIGRGIVTGLALQPEWAVVMVVRDGIKGERVAGEMRKLTGNPSISVMEVDLSREKSVRDASLGWQGPVHLLINNAGATPRQREETPEGIEMQWATNVMGYFWMIRYFEPFLAQGKPARVVNVASYWAGDLDLKDPEFNLRRYHNDTAYRQSKQADRMLTVAFANRLKEAGIAVNACHPGDVNSKLSNNLGYGGHESPEQGADTPLWVGTAEELEGVTGKYFEGRRESVCRFGRDLEAVEELFGICDKR